ncbi:hypothetical protein I4U23_027537 [Adineta vaga]|nr:hypothetical protein I4U23_027537 [Adineta vaga]
MEDIGNVLLPDYICYDKYLCNSIQPTFSYENSSCRYRQEIINIDLDYDKFLLSVEKYFRHCAIPFMMNHNEQHSSIYYCKNSSKYISKHRLMDHIIDCHLGDDEEQFELSCLSKDKYRFKCYDQDKICWSSSVDHNVCIINNQKQNFNQISFQNICDGILHLISQEINGEIHNDETECQYWPCNNIYTRCDNIKTCLNGEDEYGCSENDCSLNEYLCISPITYKRMCLPLNEMGDNIIDCLGGTDELQHCYLLQEEENKFQCWNNTQCISLEKLCHYFFDCRLESNCQINDEICYKNRNNYYQIEDLICQLNDIQNRIKSFSLKTARIYPQLETNVSHKNLNNNHHREIHIKNIRSDFGYDGWIWYCHRGLPIITWLDNETFIQQCLCPPTYYGDLCEYQNERVSLTLRLLSINLNNVYTFLVLLMDDDGQINSYEQFIFTTQWDCSKKFNLYLLYSTRPKNLSKIYFIHIDAFDKYTMIYHASWYLSIPFLFLPVNRIAANLFIPFQSIQNLPTCNLTCNQNGQCMKYINIEKFFCRCYLNWTGLYCDIPVDINDCSNDYCENNGQCIVLQNNINAYRYVCIYSELFSNFDCENKNKKLEIILNNIDIPSYILFYIMIQHGESWETIVFIKKLMYNQNMIQLYIDRIISLAFIKFSNDYYLAVTRTEENSYEDIHTQITPNQRCLHINELFPITLSRIQRIKYYHQVCYNRSIDIWCFYDEIYMCLCTIDNHTNCLNFNHNLTLTCRHNDFCENNGLCFQDDITCPTNTICICTDCYFGNRCQFYAKAFGLTLDDVLRYEIQRNLTFSQQSTTIKASASITILIFFLSFINGIFSILTFRQKQSQQVGCGLYLFSSSITTILTMILFLIKFWFVVLFQIDFVVNRISLQLSCKLIEYLLKSSIYTDNWLSGCVAIERAYSVFIGVSFNKMKSKYIAKRIICILIILIMLSIIHEPIYRDLYDDKEEQRILCVAFYSQLIQNYNSTIILIHFLTPCIINLFSALFIIIMTARQRNTSQSRLTFQQHFIKQLNEHKQILISPTALVILSLPRLIISLITTCIKSSRNPWLYLIGYFISFVPSMLMFIIFVLPSDLYYKQFKVSIKICRLCLQR